MYHIVYKHIRNGADLKPELAWSPNLLSSGYQEIPGQQTNKKTQGELDPALVWFTVIAKDIQALADFASTFQVKMKKHGDGQVWSVR